MTERDPRDPFRLKVASFLSTFDRFAMPPMLVGIARSLDVPLTQVAAAAGVYYLTYGLMQPVWGILSTRIGLARTMRWCIAAGSLATLGSALAPGVTSLTVSRAVAGGFFSAAFPAALIYVGATAASHRRQREVTDLMTGVALGTALSTVIAGSLTYVAGWRWAFALTGAVCLVSTLSVARLTELERTPFRSPLVAPLRRVLSNRTVYQLLVLAVLDGLAILGALTFLPTAIESSGRNAAVAAAVTATYGAAVLVAARVVGRMSRRVAASQFILVGSLIGAAACGLLALSVGVVTALVACVLIGVAWASMHSSLQTWATEVSPADRGLTVSFFAGSLFAGSALAAALGGPFAERLDFTRAVPDGGPRPRHDRGLWIYCTCSLGTPAVISGHSRPEGSTIVHRATLREVAERAGVHPATASRALNAATESMVNAATAARIQKVAKELGYSPNPIARSLKTSRSSSIGLVIPDLTNPLFPPIVRGVEDVLRAVGYNAWIVNTDNQGDVEAAAVVSLRQRNVEGFVFATALLDHPLLEELAAASIPMVLVNRKTAGGADIPSVTSDDAAGVALAVKHLVDLGHRHIVHLAGPQDTSTGATRRKAFRQALEDNDLPHESSRITLCETWSEEAGAHGMGVLLDSDTPFTAVIAGNDQLALGAYDALAERGLRCPADVSVVGFNDIPYIDKVFPPMTTVHIPHVEIGAEAGRLLLEQLNDPTRHPRSLLLPTTLVVRGSTGPANPARAA